MTYLLVKEKGKQKYSLLSPSTFGLTTWGGNVQEYLVKKKKYWYIRRWTAGNEWFDDEEYECKLNVVKETADLDEIIHYVTQYNEKEIEHILVDAQQLYYDYIQFNLCILRRQ